MPKHPHVELMLQYVQDAMETDKPWERWQVFDRAAAKWVPCRSEPYWNGDLTYRRKTCTITINGHEVPKPVREPLENGTRYWLPCAARMDLAETYVWANDNYDAWWLSNGLIHLTREAAEAHAKALLSFTRSYT